jgi:hypothetical protein
MKNILGITYSQFDNIVGTKLMCSYPKDVLSTDLFESISDYVIVGKNLSGKTIMIQMDGIKYLNLSICVENSKYERNSLLYAFGFVLTSETDSEMFEPILRKLSSSFLALEVCYCYRISN